MSKSPPASMWTPSPALVALHHMWDEITAHTDRDFSKWLSDEDSDLILHFQQADEILWQQSQGDPHHRYLPYVNGYPAALREPVTRYTLEEWRSMDAYVVWAVSNRSALDVRAWLGAMLWKMLPKHLSEADSVRKFATCSWALRRFVFLPPPKPAIAFQDAIQTSGHKCWSNDEMDDYDSAMTFLGRTSKAVGITSRYGSQCKPCELEKQLDEFKKRISVDDTVVLEALHSLDNIMSNNPAQYGTNLPSIVLPPSYHEAGSRNYRYQDGHDWSGASTPSSSNSYDRDATANETQISTDPISLASKPKMIEGMKSFFIRQLEFHNVHLARTHPSRPKLPWLDFEATLVEEGLKVFNWPETIARPGKAISADPNKGITGINIRDLKRFIERFTVERIRWKSDMLQLLAQAIEVTRQVLETRNVLETPITVTVDHSDQERHRTFKFPFPTARSPRLHLLASIMLNRLLLFLSPFTNVYHATKTAVCSDSAGNAKAVVDNLTRSRPLHLAVLCVLFAFHIQFGSYVDAMCVLTGILMTLSRIGALYDSLDHTSFKARVRSISILGFSIVNALTGPITSGLVLRAIVVVSPSRVLMIIQIILAMILMFLQIVCELVVVSSSPEETHNLDLESGNAIKPDEDRSRSISP
ncbi:hypothetical protein C8J56DRAFT_1176952 [Mycena floridula]|nr:hypothetical protein C8J56DRAFT_1176952 [Mycena floridula]